VGITVCGVQIATRKEKLLSLGLHELWLCSGILSAKCAVVDGGSRFHAACLEAGWWTHVKAGTGTQLKRSGVGLVEAD
jgi:hypothetical protein